MFEKGDDVGSDPSKSHGGLEICVGNRRVEQESRSGPEEGSRRNAERDRLRLAFAIREGAEVHGERVPSSAVEYPSQVQAVPHRQTIYR